MLTVGEFHVHWLRGGRFRLDGGAMFGPVPKPLWSRRYPCDEHNAIPMQAFPLLVVTPAHRILIDTGLGNKLTDKQRRNFRVEEDWAVEEHLADLGLGTEDIDFVVLTHMDWDHASGGTKAAAPGPAGQADSGGAGSSRGPAHADGGDSLVGAAVVPTFPRARYVVQKDEWEAALNPNSRTKHGYWRENWAPLLDAGLVDVVDGDVELVSGVRLHKTGGHTHGHQIVRIESGGETLLHMADLLPTHAHMNPLWVMGYDNFPLTSIEEKERWLAKARENGWWLSFYHDPFVLAAKVDAEGRLHDVVEGVLGWPPRAAE
ncbi:MAG: MBL fold metallo-hydrolase [Limnochordales bacterium]